MPQHWPYHYLYYRLKRQTFNLSIILKKCDFYTREIRHNSDEKDQGRSRKMQRSSCPIIINLVSMITISVVPNLIYIHIQCNSGKNHREFFSGC